MPIPATRVTERTLHSEVSGLIRLSGASLTVGGLMAATAFVFLAVVDPARGGHGEVWWIPAQFSVILGGMFMALGLPGLHVSQAARTGLAGVIGIVVLFAGLVLAYVGVHATEILSQPSVPARLGLLVAIAAPSLAAGTVVTGVTTWRAGVHPRSASAPLLLVIGLGLMSHLVGTPRWFDLHLVPAAFAASMAWLGLAVARYR
jgi:hypothetical protein